jgi:hypothetical protein
VAQRQILRREQQGAVIMSHRPWKARTLAITAIGLSGMLTVACTTMPHVKKVAVQFGHFWNATIVSPYGLSGTVGGPFTFKEVVKTYSVTGPGSAAAEKSKYYFSFTSQYLHIMNDTLNAADPADTWDKVWGGFGDSGVKADGSREAFVPFRCKVQDKLQHATTYWDYACELRLYMAAGDKDHRYQLKAKSKSGKDIYTIDATADEPNGTIFFTF